jgi:spermidine synthase
LKAVRLLPWIPIDTAPVPGGGELRLKRRGGEFSIMLGDNELMNSRLSGSEEALATLSASRISQNIEPKKMLIGGLGMGFTLRAALKALPPSARVEVAELVPAVIAWARGPMAEVFSGSLDDSRVTIREGDVGETIRSGAAYHAILLDVDNGPDGLTRKANDGLYDAPGLAAARKALKPGGVFGVWSSGPDEDFSRRLRKAGFAVEEVRVRAGRARGARHVIWLAVRPARD